MSVIYLDHAATTPVRPEVADAMLPYLSEKYGNPSGVYEFSSERKKEIENAREVIADTLHAKKEEIYFTSGGTESDNWAVKTIARAHCKREKRFHMITSAIEHHAVLESCQELSGPGEEVTYLGVDESGQIRLEELQNAICPDTAFLSIMYANNEIGSLQPIARIAALAKEQDILFHTDAVQAYGHLPINVKKEGIGMLSASGHKLGGPKGIGFLYVDKKVALPSFLHGGGQEMGKRAGTENVAGIIGLAKAAELAHMDMEARESQVRQLREHLISRILSEIPYSRLNGGRQNRLPGNCNVSFQFIEGASLLILLDTKGICASAGSACSSGTKQISHVLRALDLPEAVARGTLRMTLGEQNTKKEMDDTVDAIKEIVAKLRAASPEYEDYLKSELH